MANSASSIGVSCEPESASGVPTVAAVIVTYNRKELLVRCLEAVLGQSRPVDKVIVVDNCSTDGTTEFLRERRFLDDRRVDYVWLPENGGSAGGFHEGMKRAYEQGHEWLWVMDDDGMPLPETLAELLECPVEYLLRGCLVVSIDDPARNELAFGLLTPLGWAGNVRDCGDLVLRDGMLRGCVNPFNGVLISREVVHRIGLPLKELFIWGDESEYLLRAQKAGVRVGTALGARFLHPRDRMEYQRVGIGFLSFALPYADDPFRFYLIVRNSAYARLRHCGFLSGRFLKVVLYPAFFPTRAILALRALSDGIVGRLLTAKHAREIVEGR